ncbi:MAG: cell division protein FtsX, partial [Gammaproteobacteria bacterium]
MRRKPGQATLRPTAKAPAAAPQRRASAGASLRPRRRLSLQWAFAYLQRHLQVFLGSLGRLAHAPLSSLMTATVIGITLALPTGLYVVLHNLQQLSGGWQGTARISVFLKQDLDATHAQALAAKLRARPGVANVQYISPAQGLKEFRQASGFGAALDALTTNPLPPVLVVQPAVELRDPQQVQGLLNALRQLPEVDFAQLDMGWVERLYAFMALAQRGVSVVAAMLALAVLL